VTDPVLDPSPRWYKNESRKINSCLNLNPLFIRLLSLENRNIPIVLLDIEFLRLKRETYHEGEEES
jgi:hypothetical protein